MVTYHLQTPFLPIGKLPESERAAAHLLQTSLFNLESYVEDLHAARVLFDHATLQQRLRFANPMAPVSSDQAAVDKWAFIACRDGALTIYHFAMCLDAIRATAKRDVPSLDGVDSRKLREARKEFRKHFPSFESVRHGVAHAAELMKNLPAIDRHSSAQPISAPGMELPKGAFIQNTIINRNYSLTIEGKFVSYELSEASVFNLAIVRTKVFGAFPFSRLDGYGPPLKRAPHGQG